jgi:hypothetical protein
MNGDHDAGRREWQTAAGMMDPDAAAEANQNLQKYP